MSSGTALSSSVRRSEAERRADGADQETPAAAIRTPRPLNADREYHLLHSPPHPHVGEPSRGSPRRASTRALPPPSALRHHPLHPTPVRVRIRSLAPPHHPHHPRHSDPICATLEIANSSRNREQQRRNEKKKPPQSERN